MKRHTQIITLVILIISQLPAIVFGEMPMTTGTISKVTVYRGQALVTRTIEIDLPEGTSELIVEGLPAEIIPESLYAQASSDSKVLSVRYREKAVTRDKREEVQKLDLQIEDVTKQLLHADGDLSHRNSQWDNMFCKLREFTAEVTRSDLNRGLLTFEPIEKLTTLIEKKGLEYHTQATELRDNIAALKKELDLLKRKRANLNAGRSRTEREAVLYISNESKGKSVIELNYLVNGANWLPQYNLRANPDKSNVLIEYNAIVNQTSGEDWNGIGLNLSTAEPAMVAASPVLDPMAIVLADLQTSDGKDVTMCTDMLTDCSNMRQPAFIDHSEDFRRLTRSRREQAKKGAAAQIQLAQIAMSNQALEFSLTEKDLDRVKEQICDIARIEGVSVTYLLPGKLTLPSRTDQQLVTVTTVTAKADFTLVATPLLTDYVYLQAELLNNSETVFLPGPASMFRNGEFVGKSDLPIVTIGEKFTAGFGIDSQVQVTRELEDKKTRIQGGNRIDTYNYRIALSNYKNSPAELRLLDRLPYTDNESIKIELLKTTSELSQDSEYLRAGRNKGLLRWDLDLAANSIDQDAMIVNYSFTMEYDKNMQIQPRKTNH